MSRKTVLLKIKLLLKLDLIEQVDIGHRPTDLSLSLLNNPNFTDFTLAEQLFQA